MCELIPVDWHFTGGFRLRNYLLLLYKVPSISYIWLGSWLRKPLRLLGCWTGWADSLAGRQQTDYYITFIAWSFRKHKQYGRGERARTTHPCCFEWKVAPASDLDECSHYIRLDAPAWSIHPISPGWSIWIHYNGSSPVVVCTYWSPQSETNPSAPHQTHSFTSRGRTQASGQTYAHANPIRICLCTSAEARVWPPVKLSCRLPPKRLQRRIIALPARHHGANLDWVWATIRKAS